MTSFGNIEIELSILVAETAMPLDKVFGLGRGAVVPLGRNASGPLAVLANGTPIGEARVLLDGDKVSVALLGAVRTV
jgi:flagellar motor switch protein FliN/FliY